MNTLAGITSVFFTYPLELIRVRLAFEIRHSKYDRTSLLTTARKIYHEGPATATTTSAASSSLKKAAGSLPIAAAAASATNTTPALFLRFPLLKFYRGYLVSMMGMIPYAGTSFLVWGNLHAYLRSTTLISAAQKRRHRTGLDLACGAIAGAMSQTASYPFEVIRRRMQVGGLKEPGRLVGFVETVKQVYTVNGGGIKGLRGFFVGLSIGYAKVVPMTALSFSTWSFCKRLFGIDSSQ